MMDYGQNWNEFYMYAHELLISQEFGKDILSSIIQIEVQNLGESDERKLARAKVLLFDLEARYNSNREYVMIINRLLDRIELLEKGNEPEEFEYIDEAEDLEYRALWEAYQANSRFISSSASLVFSEFDEYSTYKEKCLGITKFFSFVGEVAASLESYELLIAGKSISRDWNFQVSCNSEVFDFLLRVMIACENKKTDQSMFISKRDAIKVFNNTVSGIAVLHNIIRILNEEFSDFDNHPDNSWEEMKFYLYNMVKLESFWDNASRLSMLRWNTVVSELNKRLLDDFN